MDAEPQQDSEHIHSDEDISLNPYDDSTIDHDVQIPTVHEKPKLYNSSFPTKT